MRTGLRLTSLGGLSVPGGHELPLFALGLAIFIGDPAFVHRYYKPKTGLQWAILAFWFFAAIFIGGTLVNASGVMPAR